jgi:hypothetical protein
MLRRDTLSSTSVLSFSLTYLPLFSSTSNSAALGRLARFDSVVPCGSLALGVFLGSLRLQGLRTRMREVNSRGSIPEAYLYGKEE